jgi:hypothetical protein
LLELKENSVFITLILILGDDFGDGESKDFLKRRLYILDIDCAITGNIVKTLVTCAPVARQRPQATTE